MRLFSARDVHGCLILVFVLTLVGWWWNSCGGERNQHRAWLTRQLMGSLAFQLELVRLKRGSYPDESEWLHWVSTVGAPYGSNARDTDSWGSRLVYRRIGSDSYRLVSCGSDRQCLDAEATPEPAADRTGMDIVIESGRWKQTFWADSDIIVELLDKGRPPAASDSPALGVQVSRLGNNKESAQLRIIPGDEEGIVARIDGCDSMTRPLYGMDPEEICVIQFEEDSSLKRTIFIHLDPDRPSGEGADDCLIVAAGITPPYDMNYRDNVLLWCEPTLLSAANEVAPTCCGLDNIR